MSNIVESLYRISINESTTSMHPLALAKSLLEYLSNEDFSRIVDKETYIDKNGNERSRTLYCFHHLDGDHSNNSIDNLSIILRTDHDNLKNKSIEDCDVIYFKSYVDKYIECMNREAKREDASL